MGMASRAERPKRSLRLPLVSTFRRVVLGAGTGVLLLAVAACGSQYAPSTGGTGHSGATTAAAAANDKPVTVKVFAPGDGDQAGTAGKGYVVDLSLDATSPSDNGSLSAANGYKPYFGSPTSPAFHPGPDLGAPGLVVLLSTTQAKAGTPFKGPNTNLAGLFQINGIAKVNSGSIAETWNTWLVGKAIAGAGVQSTLTVFVVSGTAPAVISGTPESQSNLISNVVRVNFTIAGPATVAGNG
jgi:hypothetical protein